MSEKPKIKVVQYLWGEQNKSYELSHKINRAYCIRHDYEHAVLSFPPRGDRANCWEKVPAIRREMRDCDYILYVDADAFFYSHELKIEEELLPLLEDKQIMMAADYACESIRHQPDKPNSGVILVRNSKRAEEILKVWDESSERAELDEFRFKLYHEQEACWRTIWKEYADEVKLLKDYYLMNGFCGIFIRHLMGKKDADRMRVMEKFLADRKGTISVTHESETIHPNRVGCVRKWGVGIMTTIRRKDSAIAVTLESFRGTGFDPPVVFTDLTGKGGLWNLHRTLRSLLEMYPDADAYAVIEDDVLFSRNIREYLEEELWPSVDEHGCICSVFTPTIYSSDKRWHVENRGTKTWMSQFRIYHPLTARKLVDDLENDQRLNNRGRQNDATVGGWAEKNNINISTVSFSISHYSKMS